MRGGKRLSIVAASGRRDRDTERLPMSTSKLRFRFDPSKVDARWLLLTAAAVTVAVLYLAAWLSSVSAARWS
jgi:hypothetical protein